MTVLQFFFRLIPDNKYVVDVPFPSKRFLLLVSLGMLLSCLSITRLASEGAILILSPHLVPDGTFWRQTGS